MPLCFFLNVYVQTQALNPPNWRRSGCLEACCCLGLGAADIAFTTDEASKTEQEGPGELIAKHSVKVFSKPSSILSQHPGSD